MGHLENMVSCLDLSLFWGICNYHRMSFFLLLTKVNVLEFPLSYQSSNPKLSLKPEGVLIEAER